MNSHTKQRMQQLVEGTELPASYYGDGVRARKLARELESAAIRVSKAWNAFSDAWHKNHSDISEALGEARWVEKGMGGYTASEIYEKLVATVIPDMEGHFNEGYPGDNLEDFRPLIMALATKLYDRARMSEHLAKLARDIHKSGYYRND